MSRPRPRPSALLVSFGALRRYDPDVTAAAEERHGLPPGTVRAIALEWPRLQALITGRVTRAEWLTGVAEALADRVGGLNDARSLVVEWDSYRGAVDHTLLSFVRETRQSGVPVALVANAADDLELDLTQFGLTEDFDAVVNSAVLGAYSPSKEFLHAACAAVATPPDRCLLLDEEDRHVRGARVAGLSAFRYSGPDDFGYLRAALAPAPAS
ncbi:haloacid dehalogenase [Virgisporangium aliadipatigenens]|uniref:Haloacid dehalogenase n=1 Tax=Virgisporangium aliadipatigenens TaxID=741659 RepID=A0A8J4DPB4_9ACTN|nr:haloacid dehalogenase [Virgisporangium aliadipatigenens]GIJ45775.1 haloacid dehalogenase [Virgisporangium aliadipatigenens]